MEESALVERAQRGDAEAFARLVARYDRTILRLALRYTGDEEEAADLHQEALWRAYRAPPRFRNDSRFSTWLYRIATNVCLQRLERRKREESRRVALAETAPERAPLRILGGPETAAQREELRRRLYAALDSLSPRQRMVFVMRHFEDLPLAEIATLLGCSTGAVKKHLFVATRRLRELLQDLYDGYREIP